MENHSKLSHKSDLRIQQRYYVQYLAFKILPCKHHSSENCSYSGVYMSCITLHTTMYQKANLWTCIGFNYIYIYKTHLYEGAFPKRCFLITFQSTGCECISTLVKPRFTSDLIFHILLYIQVNILTDLQAILYTLHLTTKNLEHFDDRTRIQYI